MSEIPPGSVTTADLYRVMVEMHKDISRALEKLALVDQRNQNADALHNDHEARLRMLEAAMPDNAQVRVSALEQFRWKIVGVAIATGAIGSSLGTWIVYILQHR